MEELEEQNTGEFITLLKNTLDAVLAVCYFVEILCVSQSLFVCSNHLLLPFPTCYNIHNV